jgi:hypothetical protein
MVARGCYKTIKPTGTTGGRRVPMFLDPVKRCSLEFSARGTRVRRSTKFRPGKTFCVFTGELSSGVRARYWNLLTVCGKLLVCSGIKIVLCDDKS